MNCKYCDRPLTAADVKRCIYACARCRNKLPQVQRFVQVCDEFKQRINYEAILRKRRQEAREKEAQENDQRTTARL